jgi:uncharacterized ferritin-like protein (DUF455 family)
LTKSLTAYACEVLNSVEASDKANLTKQAAEAWRGGAILQIGKASPPKRPSRPARPLLLAPKEMPRRKTGGNREKQIALFHALAHIELNAIDLAWDLLARFATEDTPKGFFDDWIKVADDEARHFLLLQGHLESLGACYGDLPAHDGLWEAAEETAHDLLARLAVVPLVLEARGLDVTPTMIAQLETSGNTAGRDILQTIYEDEITHVAAGKRWFDFFCQEAGLEPAAHWRLLVQRHFKGKLKAPFNVAAREAAGMESAFYDHPELTGAL